jgi:Uma2 family endonuclease
MRDASRLAGRYDWWRGNLVLDSRHPGEIMSYAMEQGPRTHRITVDELIRMAEVGLLAPDARVELIEGVIADMAPIGTVHGRDVDLISARLVLAVQGKAIVRTQGAVQLSDDTMLQPDIALLKYREDGYMDRHPSGADILLVVEVADSSVDYDFGRKLKLYARYGVPEVWVLNVPTDTLHFFRSRTDLGYREESSTRTPGILPLPSLDLTVDLSGLTRS